MICPLLRTGANAAPLRAFTTETDFDRASACLEGGCAWWVPEAKLCAVVTLGADALTAVVERRRKIDRYEESH